MSSWTWFKLGEALALFVAGFGLAWLGRVVKWFKNRKKQKWESFDINKMSQKDIRLIELLSELRVAVNASRVHIHRFHNGGKFVGGEPIKKFSCTHESVAIGVSHEITNEQNVLCSMMMPIFGYLEENRATIRKTEELGCEYLRSLFMSQSVKAFACMPLKMDHLGGMVMIGFVGFEYVDLDNIPKDEDGNELPHLEAAEKFVDLIEVELTKG